MDLKEINKQYQDLQKDLKEMNERVEKISKEAKVLVEDKIILKGKLIKAKRENDETVQKDTEKELEKLEEKLKAMKEEAMTKKAAIITTKRAIDARIEQIKADPEMKKHLESVMATKYERKLAKVRDEKEGVEQEKERFELLKTLISQHPTLENNLKGMLGAVNKGNEVKKELEEIEQKLVKDGITAEGMKAYKDKAKEYKEILKKFDTNETNLMGYIEKNKLNIKEEDIASIIDGGVIANNGKVDLTTMMNRREGTLNRQLKGYDKQVVNYEKALGNLTQTREEPEEQEVQEEEPEITDNGESAVETEEKPKWYQFIKKFKNWREARKQQQLPEPEEVEEEQSEPTNEETIDTDYRNNKGNEFRDSLKYKVVRDIVDNMEKEDLKQASQERRAEQSTQEHDDNER